MTKSGTQSGPAGTESGTVGTQSGTTGTESGTGLAGSFLLSLHHEILKSQTVSIYARDNLVTPFVTPFVKISYIIPCYSILYYVNETLIIHDKH